MKSVVRKFIEEHQLLSPADRHIVAVSGGADSVCLLLVLKQLGYHVEAAHCNFRLRGAESDRDEQFVKSLCQENDVPFHVIHFDTKSYAILHQVSIEMAARQLRYQYFEQLRQDIGAADICVAHHQDDSAETVLLNLLRGTGIHGLCGIKPRNGHVVRPLLCVNRRQIEGWLDGQHQPYVTDSTNLVADVVRNQLRLNVLPELRKICANATDSILLTAQHVSEACRVYDAAMSDALTRLVTDDGISIEALLAEPSPESVLYEWLQPHGFTSAAVRSIYQALPHIQSGREWVSDTHLLFSHLGRLVIAPHEAQRPTLRIPETGTYIYDETAKFRITRRPGHEISRQPQVACLDAAKVGFPLCVRPVRTADRFRPFGMKGTKLVSDFLTDRHLSILERRRQLVVTDSADRILWLVGQRPDADFCVSSTTRQVLQIDVC